MTTRAQTKSDRDAILAEIADIEVKLDDHAHEIVRLRERLSKAIQWLRDDLAPPDVDA
jgi:hypothetical protein